jgi:hypothetical protein
MLKKILVTLLIVPVIGAAIYGYFHFKQIKTPLSPVIQAIPTNAAFILKCNTPKASLQNFSLQKNSWKSLLSYPFFGDMHRDIHYLDGLFANGSDALKQITDKPLFISVHPDASNQFDFLYLLNLPNTLTKKQVNDFIAKASTTEPSYNLRIYDGVALNELKLNSSKTLFYFFNKGIFACTFSQYLIEDAIRQLNSGMAISADPAFDKVWNAAGKKVEATLFINYHYTAEILKYLSLTKESEYLKTLSGFANWTCLDLKIKDENYQLNGFTYSKDTSNNYLRLFKEQQPQEITLSANFPASTAYFQCITLSDVNRYFKNYDSYLNTLTSQFSRQEQLSKLNKTYGVNAQIFFKQWMGNQFAAVITEPDKEDYSSNCYAVFASNGSASVHQTIKEFSAKISNHKKTNDTVAELFRGYEIQHIKADYLVPLVFGEAFGKIKNTYLVELNKEVVIANSAAALKKWINTLLAKQTLSEDKNYISFAENSSSKASLSIYSALARSGQLFKNNFKSELLNWDETKTETLKNFHAASFQLSAKEDLFYSSIYAAFKPCYTKPASSIWETELDTTLHQRPFVLIDPKDNSRKIIVQDDAQKIYLLDNAGKVIWKRELKEKIMSEVQAINGSKNNKLQILFSTNTKIYLLDEDGDNVGKFPIVLKYKASNGVKVIDYDKNGDYRFLIAEENKRIYNFTRKGDAVNGWEAVPNNAPVVAPISSFRAMGLDYLVVVDQGGTVNLLDRKGKSVVKFKQKFKNLNRAAYTLVVDATLNSTSIIGCDSLGQFIRLYFSGKITRSDSFKTQEDFYFASNESATKFVILTKNKLVFYDENYAKISEINLNLTALSAPSVFSNSSGNLNVVVSNPDKGTLLISDSGLAVVDIKDMVSGAPITAQLFGDASWYTLFGAANKIKVTAAY